MLIYVIKVTRINKINYFVEQESPPKEKEQKPPVLASVDDVIESVISSVVRSDVISDESSKDSSSSKDLHTKSGSFF